MGDLLGSPRVVPFFLRRAYPLSLNDAISNSLAIVSLNKLIFGKLPWALQGFAARLILRRDTCL